MIFFFDYTTAALFALSQSYPIKHPQKFLIFHAGSHSHTEIAGGKSTVIAAVPDQNPFLPALVVQVLRSPEKYIICL